MEITYLACTNLTFTWSMIRPKRWALVALICDKIGPTLLSLGLYVIFSFIVFMSCFIFHKFRSRWPYLISRWPAGANPRSTEVIISIIRLPGVLYAGNFVPIDEGEPRGYWKSVDDSLATLELSGKREIGWRKIAPQSVADNDYGSSFAVRLKNISFRLVFFLVPEQWMCCNYSPAKCLIGRAMIR